MLEPVKIPQGRAGIYIAEWKSISQVAAEVLARFSVVSTSIKSTIIELSLIIENASRGKDLLNAIAMEFKRTNIEELNNSSLSTMRFINERLRMVSTELEGVESNLEKYQGGSKAYGLTQQSSQSFSNSDESSKTMNSILIKKRIVEMIRGSFSANEKNTQVPSTLGIGDPNLSEMVRKYNDLLLRKESESRNIGEKNVILVDIDKQISDLKTSIVDNLQSISKNLDFQVSDVQQQNRSYNSTISELPHKERRLQEIKREQAIKEGLFLYLLQKREEAAISSTSHPSNYEQIDPASSLGPGEPNPTFVFEIAFISAFLMPMLFFYLTDLLSDKVKSREDIIKITDLPIVGEISNLEAKSGELVTLQQPLVGEQFRSLRNNIAFLDEIAANQVILVTSASVGEGKSFISMNLAVIIAAGNKKVAFVDLNFRKDGERNNLTNVSRGITEYLQSIASLSELAKPSAVAPNLYIYSAGSSVKNPGDLLVTKRVQMLFEELKSEYDTVVVNSAPAGLVSDAQALSRYADATLFVIREGSTTKKQVDFIDTLYKTAKIQNICLVLNGVKNGARYGYRGYGRSNRHDVFTKYFIKWQKKKQEQHV